MLESGRIVKNLALTKEKVWPLPLASARLSPGPWNVMPDRCASVCLGALEVRGVKFQPRLRQIC